jgi:hypothetical protein
MTSIEWTVRCRAQRASVWRMDGMGRRVQLSRAADMLRTDLLVPQGSLATKFALSFAEQTRRIGDASAGVHRGIRRSSLARSRNGIDDSSLLRACAKSRA